MFNLKIRKMKTTKMKKYRNLVLFTLMAAFIAPFSACTKEDLDPAARKAQFRATDAPIDNAEVEAVFVTISEIYVDGKRLEGFNKTTLELSALTEGKSELLADLETSASSINKVKMVFDYETDESGMTPGCFIKLKSGVKDKISSDVNIFDFNANQQLKATGTTEIVFDFDLRKLIKEEASNDFELVSASEVEAYVRTVNSDMSSEIRGTVENNLSSADKTIVYLYEKGKFDLQSESQGSGSSQVQFAGAVNSAELNSNGEFTLAFIQEGEYEVHLIEYSDSNSDGKFELSGHAQISSLNNINLNGFEVNSESDLDLKISVTSWLPI